MSEPLKIHRFEAENFKRLKVVEITPDGAVVIIGGRNSQGKSSVLDAIFQAIGGGPAAKGTKKPIRDGEDHARVMLDLGDLIVTRTWRGDESFLKVESKDKAKYSSPQTVLDGFMGKLSFDPLEFTKLSATAQVAALLDLVDLPIDLDELASERLGHYDARTEIGRTVKSLRGQLDGLGEVEEAPAEEISQAELLAKYEATSQQVLALNQKIKDRDTADNNILRLTDELDEALALVASLDAEIEASPPIENPAVIKEQIASAEETNAKVRRNATRAETAKKLQAEEDQQTSRTRLIDEIDTRKADALANATFPVDGLGFGDEGVVFNGIPFSQSSASEQIRVSLAMAMALNPRLRVIRILDGSLLDAENMAVITSMAEAQGFQVWIERVGDGDGVGVIIEDGSVVEHG